MTTVHASPTTGIDSRGTIKEAVAHLKAKGPGSTVRLAGNFKSGKNVKNYFYRQGCNVTAKKDADGDYLVTYNSPSETGRFTHREEKKKRARSNRKQHEKTFNQLLEERNNDFKVGEQVFVKGHEYNIWDLLRRRFPEWEFSTSKDGDGWIVTRTR